MNREQVKAQIDRLSDEQFQAIQTLMRSWQQAQEREENFLHVLLSFEPLDSPGANSYQFRMEGQDLLTNQQGFLHGGALATFIDASIGTALQYELEKQTPVVTVDLHVQYLSPGEMGPLYSTVDVVKKGQRLLFAEAFVTDAQEKPIALAIGTFYSKRK